MSTTVIIGVIIVLALVAIGVWLYAQRRRRDELRAQFGPEYAHAVDEYGGRGRAETALQARAERVEQLHIRPLAPDRSAEYAREWRSVQAHFVDAPEQAIGEADRLVGEVMQARGYPIGDFEQRAADVSVDHPRVVEHYRAAHAIAEDSRRNQADTESMRQAMVHYRALFDELIDVREPARMEGQR